MRLLNINLRERLQAYLTKKNNFLVLSHFLGNFLHKEMKCKLFIKSRSLYFKLKTKQLK